MTTKTLTENKLITLRDNVYQFSSVSIPALLSHPKNETNNEKQSSNIKLNSQVMIKYLHETHKANQTAELLILFTVKFVFRKVNNLSKIISIIFFSDFQNLTNINMIN